MDPHILAAVFSLFTALSFWVAVPYTPINPVYPISTRLLGALQATASSYGAASILAGLLPDSRSFQLSLAPETPAATAIPSTADGSQYPTMTMTSIMAPPGSRSSYGTFDDSGPGADPGWILYTVFLLAKEEFWRSPNLYTVLAAILFPVWILARSWSDRSGANSSTVQTRNIADQEPSKEAIRLDELSNNCQGLNQRLDGLSTMVARLQQNSDRFDALPADIANLKGRFKTLLPEFRSLQDDLKHHTTATSALQHRSQPTDARLSSLSEDLGALKREFAAAQSENSRAVSHSTEEARRRSDNTASQLSALADELRDLKQSTSANDQQRKIDLAAAVERIAVLEEAGWLSNAPAGLQVPRLQDGTLDTAAEHVAASTVSNEEQTRLRRSVERINARVFSLTADLNTLKEYAATNESSVTELTARVDPAIAIVNGKPWEERAKSLTSKLKDLSIEVESVKEFSTANFDLEELTNKVDDLSKKQRQMSDDLKSNVMGSKLKGLDSEVQEIREYSVSRADHQALSNTVDDILKQQKGLSEASQNTNTTASKLKTLDQELYDVKELYVTKSDHQALSDTVDEMSRRHSQLSEWQKKNSEATRALTSKMKKLTDDQTATLSQSNILSSDTTATKTDIQSVRDEMLALPILSNSRLKELRDEYENYADSIKQQSSGVLEQIHVTESKLKCLEADFRMFEGRINNKGLDEAVAHLEDLQKWASKCDGNLERLNKEVTTMQATQADLGNTTQLTDLKNNMSAYATSLEDVKAQMAVLQSASASHHDDGLSAAELTDVRDKLSTYARSLDEVKQEVSKLQSTKQTDESHRDGASIAELAEVKDKLSSYATSIDDIKKTLSELPSAPASGESQSTAEITDLKNKLSTYATSLDEVRKTVSELQSAPSSGGEAELTDLKDKLSAYATSLEEVKTTVSELQSSASSGSETGLTDLKDKLSTYATGLEEVKKTVSELQSAPASDGTGLTDISGKLSTYAASLEEVKKTVSELQSGAGSGSETALTDLKDKLSAYATGLEEVKKAVSELQSASTGGSRESTAEFTDIKDKLSTYTTSLDEVKRKVSELESASPTDITKDDIAKINENHNKLKQRVSEAENYGLSTAITVDDWRQITIPDLQSKLNGMRWDSRCQSKDTKFLAEKMNVQIPPHSPIPDGWGLTPGIMPFKPPAVPPPAPPPKPSSDSQSTQKPADATSTPTKQAEEAKSTEQPSTTASDSKSTAATATGSPTSGVKYEGKYTSRRNDPRFDQLYLSKWAMTPEQEMELERKEIEEEERQKQQKGKNTQQGGKKPPPPPAGAKPDTSKKR